MNPKSSLALTLVLSAGPAGTGYSLGTTGFFAGVSPFLGSGRASTGERVLQASGLEFGAGWQFRLSEAWTLAPMAAMMATVTNTKSGGSGQSALATYDNRIAAGGMKAIYHPTPTLGLYLGALGGPGRSTLQVDASTRSSFANRSYENISGVWRSAEVGGSWQLSRGVDLLAGIMAGRYEIDQSQARGREEIESAVPEGLSLRQQSVEPRGATLADHAHLTTWTLKLGVAVTL